MIHSNQHKSNIFNAIIEIRLRIYQNLILKIFDILFEHSFIIYMGKAETK